MKKTYLSPTAEFCSLDCSLRLLESLSAFGNVDEYGDGGDLGETKDNNGTFHEY